MERWYTEPKAETADGALLQFVERLPTTIRDVVLARCCMAFGRLQYPPGTQDLFATFRSILTAPKGDARAYVCATMAAAVELALHRGSADGPEYLEPSISGDGIQGFENIDYRGPLAQKHWHAAREEFRALREDMLSTESIGTLLDASRQRSRSIAQPGRRA